VAARIQATFDEAAWHEPSIVLLDDLDQIVTACSGPDQEMSGEALYHGRIAQCMLSVLFLLGIWLQMNKELVQCCSALALQYFDTDGWVAGSIYPVCMKNLY